MKDGPLTFVPDPTERPMDEPTKQAAIRTWNKSNDFICITCGGAMYMEPAKGTHQRCGCVQCKFTSTIPNFHFKQAA